MGSHTNHPKLPQETTKHKFKNGVNFQSPHIRQQSQCAVRIQCKVSISRVALTKTKNHKRYTIQKTKGDREKEVTESFIGSFFVSPIGSHGQRPPLIDTEPLLSPTKGRRGIEGGRENGKAALVIRVPKRNPGRRLASAAN